MERLHPTPALGGLPKKEAIEKIREVEDLDRGFYGGPLGWVDYQGNGEFAVSIRSGLIQGDEASIFAGCGVVEDSDSESEYQETNIKFTPMLPALGGIKIMNHQQSLTAYIVAFVAELVQTGVKDVVVSPGSRSTPMAMVMAEHPDFEFIFMWMNVRLLFLRWESQKLLKNLRYFYVHLEQQQLITFLP